MLCYCGLAHKYSIISRIIIQAAFFINSLLIMFIVINWSRFVGRGLIYCLCCWNCLLYKYIYAHIYRVKVKKERKKAHHVKDMFIK